MTSGVSVRLTRVATRSPTARPSGDSGPTSSTVPTSMPPEPVSGFCILPRVATMSSTSARTASPCFSPYFVCLRSSWRNDAASRLSRSTRIRTSSGHSSARVSSRWAAWGSTTPSSRTRCRPVGSLVRTSAWMSEEVFMQGILLGSSRRTANLAAWHWTRRMFSTYSPRCVAAHTTGAPSDLTPAAAAVRGHPRRTHEHRDRHLAGGGTRHRPALPLPAGRARRARLDALPRLDGRDRRGVGLGPVAARPLHQERQAAARADGRPARRAVLRRPRARPGRAGHDVDARAAADDEHDGADRDAGRPGLAHRGVLRRPGPPLHDPGLQRPPHRLALAPARRARLAPRARHVGDRGPHPPLPHQGARRAAADLPAVLRPLHPHGPRRQLDRGHRQAEVRRQAQRPARRHDRLPASYAVGARRRGLRRRRRQHAVAAPRGVPHCRCSRSTTSATSGSRPRP